VQKVTLNPALDSASAVSPGTTVLIGEIASLKSRLELASRESVNNANLLAEAKTRLTDAQSRLTEAQSRANMAELRVQEAEKALHDLAGKNAVGNMTATRTISDLQSKLAALHHTIASFVDDYKADLDTTEIRAAALREKISKLGA
jgi:chromosome segregation ATPase